MCRPRLTPVKSCLAVLRPFTQTHTSPVPLHLWLECLWLCENPCVCVLWIRRPLLYTLRDRCIQWFTYSKGQLLLCMCVHPNNPKDHTHTCKYNIHPRLITHAHNPTHTHLPVDRGLRRWNPAAVTVVRRSSRISTETRAWLLSDPARLSSSGKKNAVRRRGERQREAGWRRKRGRGGRWFGHGPVWEYLITNIKNTTERLCHIPTVQLQPGPDSTVINTSYRVAPECTYSTTHTYSTHNPHT